MFFCLCFSNCDRRDLTYYTEAEIEINADWSQAGLSEAEQASGATAVFYPQDGGTPKVVLMGDRTRKTVRLREGRYDVILFNRSFNDFSGISFRGEDYRSLEAYAKNLKLRNGGETSGGYEVREGESESSGDIVTDGPDELAVDHIENFEVTSGMLGNYSSGVANRNTKSADITSETDACRLCFTPRKLTKQITAKIHIKGLHNVRTATCTLSGVTASVFLATGTPSDKKVTQEFDLGNPVFLPGSFTEGTLTGTFSVFGLDEELPHNMHFEALLADGKTTFEEDITVLKIEQAADDNGNITITIDVDSSTTVPDVKPEGGSDSGFNVDVGGWGDDVNTDVPI